MPGRSKTIFSLGAALASLAGAHMMSSEAQATSNSTDVIAPTNDAVSAGAQIEPSGHFQVGEDLLGFVVTRQADGTLIAQHASHASHASHHSHASHASSRY